MGAFTGERRSSKRASRIVSSPEAAYPRNCMGGIKNPSSSRVAAEPPSPETRKGAARKFGIDMQELGSESHAGGDAGDSAEEEIKRDFPGPDRGSEDGKFVVRIAALDLRVEAIAIARVCCASIEFDFFEPSFASFARRKRG